MASVKKCIQCGECSLEKHFVGHANVCKTCKSVSFEPGVLYLLCDADDTRPCQRYKIGKHTGTREDLLRRYKTYIPHTEILRFVSVSRARTVEAYIHRTLSSHRVGSSEWFQVDEAEVVNVFDNCVDEFA